MKTTPETALIKNEALTRIFVHQDGGQKVVHKAYRSPPALAFRTFRLRSRAEREYHNLNAVVAAGIPCLVPLAWGEDRRLGCVRSCWIETRYEPDLVALRDFVRDPGLQPAGWPRLRRRLAVQMALLIRRLHEAGILWLTVTPRNVLVRGRPEDLQLWVCDMPKSIRFGHSQVGCRRSLLDLFELGFAPHRREQFNRGDRLAMLIGYCDGDRARARQIWRQLRRRSKFGNTCRRRFLTLVTRTGLVRTAPFETTSGPDQA